MASQAGSGSIAQRDAVSSSDSKRTKQKVATFVPLETNTWTLQLAHSGANILCDPWLTGKLTFASQSWLIEGTKTMLQDGELDIALIERSTDFILISQTLDDHLHRPTLQRMSKDIPIVGSSEIVEIVRDMGFRNTVTVDHGQTIELLDGKLLITATQGALVGPPWDKRQLGFLIQERGGVRVYYEPHSNFVPSSLRSISPVDVVITPTTSAYIGGVMPLVEGFERTPEALSILKPKVLVPLMNNTSHYDGLIAPLITAGGYNDPWAVEEWLRLKGIEGIKVVGPQTLGEPLDIML